MHKQVIRMFIGIRDGAVRVLRTDPVLTPQIKKIEGGGRDAEDGAVPRAEKRLYGN